jgi:hypothetical protein
MTPGNASNSWRIRNFTCVSVYLPTPPPTFLRPICRSVFGSVYFRTHNEEWITKPLPHYVCDLADKKTGISLRLFRSNCQTCCKEQSDNPLEMFVTQFTSSN